jgi:bifunctional UDP-N-acetylglucosamine pyrophosphorylase/glucosamine-1-phosphate N-acetyltransferase
LSGRLQVVVQDPPAGTGDAVRRGLAAAGEARWLVALFADHPTLTGESVVALVEGGRASGARVTILTCLLPKAGAYGRVVFEQGWPVRIVEARDDDPAARDGPAEINSGMMLFDVAWLRNALPRLTPSPTTGELYMTDLVALAVADGPDRHGRWPVATVRADPEIALGINDRAQLAEADAILRQRIRRALMDGGVTLVGPETIFVDAGVEIGPDTTLLPFTTIETETRIGAGCTIGPQAHLVAATIGDRVAIRSATVVHSTVEDGADIGPYSHVRGGSVIGAGVHVGTTAEINRAHLGEGTKVGHFSYVGDATVGAGVNIGAGAITANYDGRDKHRTEIGDGAFIGSDTVLVAPLRIGLSARTGAGSVVTRDVAAETTVVGVPARPIRRRDGETERRRGGEAGGQDGGGESIVPSVPPSLRPSVSDQEDD